MYQLLKINRDAVTRFLELQNVKTGTKDWCFDDSALLSETDNFNFMEIGKLYDCKIVLAGEPVCKETDKSVQCKIINDNVNVGKIFVEVDIKNDTYYIPKEQLKNSRVGDEVFFECGRMDLLEVDNVVHVLLL